MIRIYPGVGVGMARDAAGLMVGQYFKRRRELVTGSSSSLFSFSSSYSSFSSALAS